jgi:hypothetical protein
MHSLNFLVVELETARTKLLDVFEEANGTSKSHRGPEGCVENGSAASLLVSHVSIQICSFSASPARTASQTTHFERNETQGI